MIDTGAFRLTDERKREITAMLPEGKGFGDLVIAVGRLEEEGRITELEAAVYCEDVLCRREDLSEEEREAVRRAEDKAVSQSRQRDLLRGSEELAYLQRMIDGLDEFIRGHALFLKEAGFSLLLDMRLAGKQTVNVVYGPGAEVKQGLEDLTRGVLNG